MTKKKTEPVPSYDIESNVPQPDYQSFSKYPLNKMEVGDSFTFSLRDRPKIIAAIARHRSIADAKFVTRTIDKDQARVWRTS